MVSGAEPTVGGDLIRARPDIAAPVLALTFDDGPSPWTDPITDELERHGGRATFFVLGEAIERADGRRTLRRLVDGGHAGTTYNHPELRRLDRDAIRTELRRAGAAIEQVPGTAPPYWRAPFFRCDGRVREAITELAGREVWHSNVPGDWVLPAEETIVRVLDGLAPGDIVVLHDGRPATEPPELS